MSVFQFPRDLYILKLETPETYAGSYDWQNIVEIGHGNLWLYKHGNQNITNERIRLNFYSTETKDNLLFSSSWANLSDIPEMSGSGWLGKIRCDFNRNPIDQYADYFVFVEVGNYIENNEVYYLSAILDTDLNINTKVTPVETGIGIELFGYEET